MSLHTVDLEARAFGLDYVQWLEVGAKLLNKLGGVVPGLGGNGTTP